MSAEFDPEAIFRKATGREMGKQHADEYRRLRANMPDGLADSLSYNFDLILKYDQWQKLRTIIADAFDVVTEQCNREARRIRNASPESSRGFLRGLGAACFLIGVSSSLGAAAVFALVSTGIITPHLSRTDAGKVAWADAVQARIGRSSIDWTSANGSFDPSLQNILDSIKAGAIVSNPLHNPTQVKNCRMPSAVSGRSSCRYALGSRGSRAGRRLVRH